MEETKQLQNSQGKGDLRQSHLKEEEDQDQLDYFAPPKFDNLIDRYYTRYYKKVNPKMISEMLGKLTDTTSDDQSCLDQYYFEHSNKLILFGISQKHEAVVNHATNPIISVNFDTDRKRQRGDNQVVGKSKSKINSLLYLIHLGGAIRLDPKTVVCEIKCQDGKYYKVRSFISNAHILELNKRLLANPEILALKVIFHSCQYLFTQPENEGYLAIFGVKKGDEQCKVLNKIELLNKDQYALEQ
ncbi:UNKNOWN [Stylonychia lemnae]|uniref:Uncharacterized protein n=1 Tax=Stylonychia lemnae TaxID=5949 RepID=A0A078B6E6_STYLE|nr:UNKNOWN [Stylonychia lemnae]|eukprot:CDW89801.1 UNKNOWN [Stylonychia lemnae]